MTKYPSGEKEKARLLSEIERLIEESSVVEEEYSSVVEERERLEGEMVQLKETVSSLQCERENTDNKLAKVSENLKKVRVLPSFIGQCLHYFTPELAFK